ncbi:MAG: hypothetical protein H6873_02170 [Hyphomicrobiaceae bacterium]|nr:hypothetical protein [Hyphomicrobiaceae bacterium]
MTTTPTLWKGLSFSGDGLLPVGYSDGGGVTETFDNMVALPGGGFILFWQDIISYQAQVYDAEGHRQGNVLTILPYDNVALLQSFSRIITLKDGTTLVAVDSTHNTDFDYRLLAFNPDGTIKSDSYLTTLSATHVLKNTLSLTALADGGYVAAWHAQVTTDATYELMAVKRYSADGTAQSLTGGPVVWDNTNADPSDDFSAVAVRTDEVRSQYPADSTSKEITVGLAGGGFVAMWVDFSNDLFGRLFDANGVPQDTPETPSTSDQPFDINDASTSVYSFSAEALSGGGFTVAWIENSPGFGSDLHFAAYAADGTKLSGDTNLSEDPGGGEVLDMGYYQGSRKPELVSLKGGGFALVWLENDYPNVGAATYSIKLQTFNADGTAHSAAVLLDQDSSNTRFTLPEMIELKDGSLLLAWYDVTGANHYQAARYDIEGNKIGATFVPISGATQSLSPESPHMALLSDGRVLVSVNDETFTTPFTILDPRDKLIRGDSTGETVTSRKDGATVLGLGGDDTLLGQNARDVLRGGKGNDTISGGRGNDVIEGDKGNDNLRGDQGHDLFTFARGEGSDVILDFRDRQDRLDLRAFHFRSEAAALKHFSEVGSAHNHVARFDYRGTHVKIKGVDLSQIDGHDFLI